VRAQAACRSAPAFHPVRTAREIAVKYRLCAHNNRVCVCGNTEMQPCLSALIEAYLDTLRWSVLTDGADVGPGYAGAISECRRDIRVLTRAFDSELELRRWLASGSYLTGGNNG